MKKYILLAFIAVLTMACNGQKGGFPTLDQDGKIAVVAHRGFWNCEQAGYSENSLAALQAAIDNGFWGCELDVHLTADGQVVVNHDGSIEGKEISQHNYADFAEDLLPNGERRPLLDEYLAVAAKDKKITLVLELKSGNPELLDKSVELLKKHKLFKPERVVFISFSKDACERIASLYPKFHNQYLNGGMDPAALAELGINGLDYGFWELRDNPGWIGEAHELGLSTNAWTADYEGNMQEMIGLNVDAITTNYPLVLRVLLGEREFTRK